MMKSIISAYALLTLATQGRYADDFDQLYRYNNEPRKLQNRIARREERTAETVPLNDYFDRNFEPYFSYNEHKDNMNRRADNELRFTRFLQKMYEEKYNGSRRSEFDLRREEEEERSLRREEEITGPDTVQRRLSDLAKDRKEYIHDLITPLLVAYKVNDLYWAAPAVYKKHNGITRELVDRILRQWIRRTDTSDLPDLPDYVTFSAPDEVEEEVHDEIYGVLVELLIEYKNTGANWLDAKFLRVQNRIEEWIVYAMFNPKNRSNWEDFPGLQRRVEEARIQGRREEEEEKRAGRREEEEGEGLPAPMISNNQPDLE